MYLVLTDNYISDLKVNPDDRHRVYRLYSLKFWLSHCVNTIHAYFMLLAPWHSGKTLDDIMKEADSIDDMISGQLRVFTLAPYIKCPYLVRDIKLFNFKTKEKIMNGRLTLDFGQS